MPQKQLKKVKLVRKFSGQRFRLKGREYNGFDAVRRAKAFEKAGYRVHVVDGKDALGNQVFRIYTRKRKKRKKRKK